MLANKFRKPNQLKTLIVTECGPSCVVGHGRHTLSLLRNKHGLSPFSALTAAMKHGKLSHISSPRLNLVWLCALLLWPPQPLSLSPSMGSAYLSLLSCCINLGCQGKWALKSETPIFLFVVFLCYQWLGLSPHFLSDDRLLIWLTQSEATRYWLGWSDLDLTKKNHESDPTRKNLFGSDNRFGQIRPKPTYAHP